MKILLTKYVHRQNYWYTYYTFQSPGAWMHSAVYLALNMTIYLLKKVQSHGCKVNFCYLHPYSRREATHPGPWGNMSPGISSCGTKMVCFTQNHCFTYIIFFYYIFTQSLKQPVYINVFKNYFVYFKTT